jgi:hypothetical protein
MKLINLIPLKEIDFRNQDQFDDYAKQHSLRPDTKVTIAGKVTTAGKAAQKSKPTKGSSVFGKDKGDDVFGKKSASGNSGNYGSTPGPNFQLKTKDDWDRAAKIGLLPIKGPDGKTIENPFATDKPKEAPKANLPKKASQLNYKHASSIADVVNAESGLDGYVDTDDNTDAIMYHGKQTGIEPTYTLYFGANDDYGKPDEFRVSLESTYGNDPAKLGGKYDKSFKSGDDAVKYMTAIAKKHKKELQMDDDDTND